LGNVAGSIAVSRVGLDVVEVASKTRDHRKLRMDAPFILGKDCDVLQRRIGHAHRVGYGGRSERHRRGKHRGLRPARAKTNLADHRHGRRGCSTVTAAVAVERDAGGQQVVVGWHQHGLQIEAWRPHALFGLRQHVEPHDGNRKESARGWRRKLHGKQILEQALGALVVGVHRQVRQPGRDGLRFVSSGHAIEPAVRKRCRVEEVRLRKVSEADVFHAALLVAQFQGAFVGEFEQG
jgi:hypothetical protein